MKPPPAARMTDMAQAAGVALATVSRALDEPEEVAPETRASIQAAIEKLGYVPDLTAGSLVSALVVTGAAHTAAVRTRLRDLEVPVVETWDLPVRPVDMAVGFSNSAAGAEAARHPLSRGRSRLAFIGGDEQHSRMRLARFERHLQAGKLDPPITKLASPPSSIAIGRQLMAEVASSSARIDGGFAATTSWRSAP